MTARYRLDDATEEQLATARRMNDRDVRRTLAALARLGAVTLTEDSAELTAIGRFGIRRMRGEPEPGDPVHRITVTLAEVTEPRVWRRLLIPATMPLSRLHSVIQTAMGWRDHHLHSFTAGSRSYGLPDLVLADAGDEEHDDMVTWLGFDHACEFDPTAFDIEAVNPRARRGRLATVTATGRTLLYGPEMWRAHAGVEWSHWDLWFALLCATTAATGTASTRRSRRSADPTARRNGATCWTYGNVWRRSGSAPVSWSRRRSGKRK